MANIFPTEAGEDMRERIVNAVLAFTARRGYPPTYREIGRETGISSTGALAFHLNKLKRQGVITWEPGCPRTLAVVAKGRAA